MCSDLKALLRRHRRFTASFVRLARFPDGMIHLLPEEESPFRRLTADLAAAFPDRDAAAIEQFLAEVVRMGIIAPAT